MFQQIKTKLFWLVALSICLAACTADSEPIEVTRVVETAVPATITPAASPSSTLEVAHEVLLPQPTATPAACTPLTAAMRLEIIPESDIAFHLNLSGLQPGDSLIFLLMGTAVTETTRLEDKPIATVSPEGEFSTHAYNLGHYGTVKQWQGQVIHSLGVTCFDLTLPLPDEPMVYEAEAVIVPTATTAVTPTPLPTVDAATPPCLDGLTNDYTSPAGQLRVDYQQEGQWWQWHEETGASIPLEIPILPDGFEMMSQHADGKRIALSRWLDARTAELWLAEGEITNRRLLTTVYADDVLERYPEAISASFFFEWIPNSNWIAYRFHPQFDSIGDVPVQMVYALDVTDGRSWHILSADEFWSYRFTPDGYHLMALSADTLRLVEVGPGRIVHDAAVNPLVVWDHQSVMFSPNREMALLYVEEGILTVDLVSLATQLIEMPIKAIGLSHYSWLPDMVWLDDGRFYTLVPASDTFDDGLIGPEATFTVWLVDTVIDTATPVNSFSGFVMDVAFTAGYGRLAAWIQNNDNLRVLYLADVNSGQQIEYTRRTGLQFLGWSPDNERFIYQTANTLLLGRVCAEPEEIDSLAPMVSVQWVDAQRFLSLNQSVDGGALRLNHIDGASILIARLTGENPYFGFHFEE